MPIAHIKRPTGRSRENWSDRRIRADKQVQKDYGDLLSLYLDHPVEYIKGVLRWKRNALACWLCDNAGPNTDLNAMAVAFRKRSSAFPLEDYTKFYRDIGYSLCGFIEVFGDDLGLYGQEV